MSAYGTKQTFILMLSMSAFGGKADVPDLKICGNTIGGLARPPAEKQRNDRSTIERILFRILLRTVFGHDEGRPGQRAELQSLPNCRKRATLILALIWRWSGPRSGSI